MANLFLPIVVAARILIREQPSAALEGVGLTAITSVALVFEQTGGGSVLVLNSEGRNEAYSGIDRFAGSSACTGVFIHR